MTHHLSDEEQARYRAQGFLVRSSVFCAAELAELTSAVECAAQAALQSVDQGKTYFLDTNRFVDIDFMTVQFEHEQGSNTVRVIEPVHHLDPRLDALLDDPRLVSPMQSILGTEAVAMWTNKLNLKRAGGSGFGWHQDSPYWIHGSSHVDLLPNVMVVLDDADRTNGCLQVIEGSHQRGCLPGCDDGRQLGGFYTGGNHVDESRAVAMEVPAGSIVLFDPHTIHGSLPNNTGRQRRALILTYQPANHPSLKSGKIRNIRSPD